MAEEQTRLVNLAKCAEQCERYDDMAEYMTKLVELNPQLNDEQRNLLSVAFKNVVGARRSANNVVSSILWKTGVPPNEQRVVRAMVEKIEKEIHDYCTEVLKLISDKLLPAVDAAKGDKPKVFFLKMQGNYNRYLLDIRRGRAKNEYEALVKKVLVSYQQASSDAAGLSASDPLKIQLALDFSVFYYEIIQNPQKACTLAKNAFDAAVDELDALTEENYKKSTNVMQLLRDNLTLWTGTGKGNAPVSYDDDDDDD